LNSLVAGQYVIFVICEA